MSYGQNLERITLAGASAHSVQNFLSDIRIIVRGAASQGYMNIARLCKTLGVVILVGTDGRRPATVLAMAQSFLPEACEHLRFDIAATDDCNIQLGSWEFVGVKDETGGCNCAAWFSNGVRIGGQVFQRPSDFVFRDGDDVVNVGADVLEVDRADALSAKAVGERAGDLLGGKLDDLALA